MPYPSEQSPEQWAIDLKFAELERKHGLPKGILTNLVRQESGGRSKAVGDKTKYGRALGLFQFIPSTASSMGVDPFNPESAAEGGARYLEKLMDRFDGDPIKALAAYNWGQGNLAKLLKKYPDGDEWKNHLPPETANYIRKVGVGIGKTYAERKRAGEKISKKDKEEETERRIEAYKDAGGDPLIAKALEKCFEWLSDLFFKLIKPLLEGQLNTIDPRGVENTNNNQDQGVDVPSGSTVSPLNTRNVDTRKIVNNTPNKSTGIQPS